MNCYIWYWYIHPNCAAHPQNKYTWIRVNDDSSPTWWKNGSWWADRHIQIIELVTSILDHKRKKLHIKMLTIDKKHPVFRSLSIQQHPRLYPYFGSSPSHWHVASRKWVGSATVTTLHGGSFRFFLHWIRAAAVVGPDCCDIFETSKCSKTFSQMQHIYELGN